MGPDVLTDGKLDPAKMQEKAARVGGLPAAELLGKLYESGLLQERYRATEETNTDRFRPGKLYKYPATFIAGSSAGPISAIAKPAAIDGNSGPKT